MEENSRPVKKVAEEKEDALGAILHLPPSKVLLFFLTLSRFLGRTVKKAPCMYMVFTMDVVFGQNEAHII